MWTLSTASTKTNWMMEQIRYEAIEATVAKFEDACHNYYKNGYDNGESVRLVKELMDLGVDLDYITDIEFAIRDLYGCIAD